MNKVRLKTKYLPEGEYELCWDRYLNGNGRSLRIEKDGKFEIMASINVEGISCSLKDNLILLKGWGENKGLPEALEDAGIVKLTGNKVKTGVCYALEAEII